MDAAQCRYGAIKRRRRRFRVKRPNYRSEPDNKRTAERVSTDLLANLRIGARSFGATVEDLSPAGARVTTSSVRGMLADGGEMSFSARPDVPYSVPFSIVARTDTAADRTTLQVRFRDVSRDSLRALSTILVPHYTNRKGATYEKRPGVLIEGFDHVATFLAYNLMRKGRTLSIVKDERVVLTGLRVEAIDPATRRLSCRSPDALGLKEKLPDAPFRLVFAGELAVSTFEVSHATRERDLLIVDIPDHAEQRLSRLTPRVPVAKGRVELAFRHPRLESLDVSIPLEELSYGGFSFSAVMDDVLLFLGERIDEVVLRTDRNEYGASATVRNMRPDQDGQHRLGMQFETTDDDQPIDQWWHVLFGIEYPEVATASTATLEPNYGVLERSGYIAKTGAIDLEELHDGYNATWKKLAKRKDLAAFVLYPKDSARPEGTMSLNRLYPDMWAVHHLAIDRTGSARDKAGLFAVAEQIFGGMATYMYYNDTKYFLACFQAFADWNITLFQSFLRTLKEPINNIFDVYDLYRWVGPDVSEGRSQDGAVLTHGLAARVATSQDIEAFRRLIVDSMSAFERDAYSYDADDVLLKDFSTRYTRDKLLRRRVILAVGETPNVGYAVCELVQPGLNVFEIFNNVRLFIDNVPTVQRTAAISALASSSSEIYQAEGLPRFFLADHDRSAEHRNVLHQAGYVHVEPIWRWLSCREVLPYYRNYVNEAIVAYLRGEARRT